MANSINSQLNAATNELFNEYFSSLTFHKIKENGEYSLYYSRVVTQTMSGYKYVIATVNRDTNIPGTKKKIKNLDWVTLQTRELRDEYLIKPCELVVTRSIENIFSQIMLTLKSRTDSLTTYDIENNQYPLEACLIHKKDYDMYPDRLALNTAIKSFKFLLMKLDW